MGAFDNTSDSTALPQLSSGTLTLLSIALRKDRDKRLTRGPAIRAAYECVGELPAVCRAGEPAVRKLLAIAALPPNLFRFSALLLDAVERRIIAAGGEIGPGGSRRWQRSEYEHPILLALGQTVARAVGMTRSLGPDVTTAIARLANADPKPMQRQLIANYLGNILQDYFDACQVRLRVRSLPDNTEENLRRVEAHNMAEWVFDDAPADGPALSVEQVEQRLGQLMMAVFLEEGKRTQARRNRITLSASEADRISAEESFGPPDAQAEEEENG